MACFDDLAVDFRFDFAEQIRLGEDVLEDQAFELPIVSHAEGVGWAWPTIFWEQTISGKKVGGAHPTGLSLSS